MMLYKIISSKQKQPPSFDGLCLGLCLAILELSLKSKSIDLGNYQTLQQLYVESQNHTSNELNKENLVNKKYL